MLLVLLPGFHAGVIVNSRQTEVKRRHDSDQALCFVLKEAELPNVVPESLAEQTLDFSIDLVDPGYRELLDDPDSPQYIDLAHHLQDQVWPP